MKFIYLHGYNGFVSMDKRNFLDTLGGNYVPEINYDRQPTIIHDLIEKLSSEPVDFISGTSLGAVVAYFVGINQNIPVLMFNPAVTFLEMIKAMVPEAVFSKIPTKPNYVFTGLKDNVILPAAQKKFIEDLRTAGAPVNHFEYEQMTHYVDYPEFKEAFTLFLDEVNFEKK